MTGILLIDIALIAGLVWFGIGVVVVITKIFLGP